MSKPVVEAQVRAVVATSGGCAVFLGNEDKVFVMFVDESVGTAIAMFMRGTQKERPLTHDLLANILRALEAKIERVAPNPQIFRIRGFMSNSSRKRANNQRADNREHY